MKKYALTGIVLMALPMVVSAQATITSLLATFKTILVSLVPIAIGLAVVLFLFGVIKYITAGDSEESRKSGRQLMLWGIIALFVMVSVWGLVNVLTLSTGINQGTGATGIPVLP